MAPHRVIVTGSTGFVGRSLAAQVDGPFEALHFGAADWRSELEATDFTQATVLHLAGRAHRGGTTEEFRTDNLEKTRAIVEAAASGGARRVVFLSTVKVNGEETRDRCFAAEDPPAPEDEYGRSKWAAENAIVDAGSRSGLEYTIVRAPLVYGAGVRGNLLALLRIADTRLPLPFAAIDNRRSFLHVDDLARLLLACAAAPHAAGRTYLAAHPAPVSTPRLVTLMREKLERPARLFPVPTPLLEATASMTGQGERMRRLTRSLEVDPSRAERELDWAAQISIETAIEDMVSAYRAEIA
jgi:nucleoside-diphosphate-sugar epimerase